MKILIVSDTHGINAGLETALELEQPIDMLLHLGDIEGSEDYIEEIAQCPCEMVAGNNDFFSSLDWEKELTIGNNEILMTHGNYYYVSLGTENLKREGIGRGKNIVMFGHTHKPVIDVDDEVTIINPGSLSYPRQEGKRPTYIIMEVDENGDATFELKELKEES